MPHYDLSEYLSDDTLTLDGIASTKHPDGKAYRIPSPSARFGLQLQRLTQLQAARGLDTPPSDEELVELLGLMTDDTGELVDFHERLMGPAYQEMVNDGVSADRMQMIRTVVITHYGQGGHVAQAMVTSAGEAKARGNRASRRASTRSTAKKTAGSKSARASTAGTRSGRAKASPPSASSTSPTGPEGQRKAI